jgi:hypothetical protein
MTEQVYTMFHGTHHPESPFNYQYLGRGNQQNGPGWYFTSEETDAWSYAFPEGFILECALYFRKMITSTAKPRRLELMEMIHGAPSWKEGLWADFGEDPVTAMRNCLRYYMAEENQHEAFLALWGAHYMYDPQEYCRNMVKLGYDGVYVEWGYHSRDQRPKSEEPFHIISFDNKKIEVVATLDKAAFQKRENEKTLARVRDRRK